MQSTMMDFPLTLPHLLERAGKLFPKEEIVTRRPDRSLHRYTFGDFYQRSRRLASALQKAGLQKGDRVATLSWNTYAHLEAYFGVPVAGGVLHPLNLRLHPSDIAYIINHAQDRFLIVDDVLLKLYEAVKEQVNLERVIVVPLSGQPLPEGLLSYEDFLATGDPDFAYPALDERDAAAMCYTSGTTGKPKGVVYSHRSIALHSLASALPDALNLAGQDVLLPVVPMFHVLAWGLPFTGVMVGSKLVLPGPHLDPVSLLELFESEQVTKTAGVPTIWLGVLQALEKEPTRWQLRPMEMVVGGSAAPEAMIRAFDRLGHTVLHAWGMTEMSPLGTVSRLKRHLRGDPELEYRYRAQQGLPTPWVEIRAVGEQGPVPWDGQSLGELQVRGPWVAASYYNLEEESDKWTEDGWFRTGDVVAMDPEGYIRIADRTKDLIKSGGEWISSIDLENALMAHPAVKEAAVIAIPDPKWDERPLAVVVLKEGQSATPEELARFLEPRFAKWWLPDAYVFLDEIPRTSTGKFLKSRLREQFRDYKTKATPS
ncbi:long-chain fatty acid--CoA ligase [Meiothermus taiwanensis]|uniref:Long-chain-fatty-acid--CoA ligase n=2 Tax=Meiothermus taiwanensis TaxID=172827 RepID=A0A399EAL2_9DEIN|nr:long-chain fatty acid--CoA ligase [Meiothermus taiwanensis]AWR87882.1 AMP-dependent synthetase and ligase [Meiothermus taiwanensis WR-220]KZK16213.1 long-chain fatty acid--CoA ligase [Meiothermus taiwanensis]RIH79930.1 Long-chain-fatty-acid--CoA ligase [Meiothermus taiwanensis]